MSSQSRREQELIRKLDQQHGDGDHERFKKDLDRAVRLQKCERACEGIEDPEKAIPAMREALRGAHRLLWALTQEGLLDSLSLHPDSTNARVDAIYDALRLAEGDER